jgi:hypothetical protein
MPRRYDKTDLRAEINMAKISTDNLRKELNLRRPYTQIPGWSQPYEVLIAKSKPLVKKVEEPKPNRVGNPTPYKHKPKQKFRPQFKKAF